MLAGASQWCCGQDVKRWSFPCLRGTRATPRRRRRSSRPGQPSPVPSSSSASASLAPGSPCAASRRRAGLCVHSRSRSRLRRRAASSAICARSRSRRRPRRPSPDFADTCSATGDHHWGDRGEALRVPHDPFCGRILPPSETGVSWLNSPRQHEGTPPNESFAVSTHRAALALCGGERVGELGAESWSGFSQHQRFHCSLLPLDRRRR